MMLHVVRHGRTTSNARGLLLGRANPSLDEVGKEQAARAAAFLPPGSLVLSSPLARTQQTAAVIAAEVGGTVQSDERWIELDYGEWDERPLADVSTQDWATWRNDSAFTPPGGESLDALSERVWGALDQLQVEHGSSDRDIVVVTHVSPIKAAVAWALGVGIETSWRTFVAPGSVTRVAMTSRGPSLHAFNLSP